MFIPKTLVLETDFEKKKHWFSNILIMSVPDEGYFRNASWALYSRSTSLFHKLNTSIHKPTSSILILLRFKLYNKVPHRRFICKLQ